MSNGVAFHDLEKDDAKITYGELSPKSKPTDREIAAHNKTRWVLVVLFGIAILAMVVVAIIIIVVAPRCEVQEVPDDSGKSNDTSKANDTLKANEKADDSWWKHAVIYQVYPRSFYDSKGDGNGTLKGITSKLDHFSELGVDALWLNPVYESPMADGGYDVKNYTAIDKMFGTMDDFDEFLAAAQKKGLKIIMDFVPNHTSDQHPWFVESKFNKSNTKRDWYIWRNGTGANKKDPPNNWLSVFGGSAWEYDKNTKQFYLHQFKKEEPDLNLTNKAVINELKKVLKFWLGKKVDGFRVDAVQYFIEDDKFEDEPTLPGYNKSNPQYDKLDHKYTFDLEQDHNILKDFRDVLTSNGSHLLIADVHGDYAKTSSYFTQSDIPKNFGLISKVKRKGKSLAQGIEMTITEYLEAVKGKTPNWVIGDHDAVRVGSRDGVGKNNRASMNVLLLTLPGVVTCYYGEEIGMLNGNISTPPDPRDNERTPMQWNNKTNAGFTSGKPWLPVAPGYTTLNVKTEKADPKSFYNNYIMLVKLRKDPAFASDDFKIVHVDKDVLSYTRGPADNQYLVSINFGNSVWTGDFDRLSGRGMVVFDSESDAPGNKTVDVNRIKLNPGQVLIVNRGEETWYEK